ncbi:hypothetical protein DFH07DRAFT_769455 [Mycena maculata]|uniref:Uncharacterized protein n=1 Tax=Mycena maculata TaxID=230809 RepID=A0AAD7NMG6_9AGAR|nr:hypothetical protein DFH07DRAFT_769455 [Mycena maculata]
MDVSAIGHFYGSVVRFPEGFAVPPGGLARFLREDLRAKVFLVSSSVFDDRWATHTRKTLTADELFNIRGCIFEGDNGPVKRGVGLVQMALAQTEFLLLKCSESFMIQRSMEKTGFLDYKEYNPHRTVEMYFTSRRAPELYEKVPVGAVSIPEFDIGRRQEYWTEAERVVEAILVALSRCNIPIRIQTYQDGEVISICRDSIDGIIVDMVTSTSPSASHSDKSRGIWEYVPSVQGSEHPMRSVAGSSYVLVEKWTAGVKKPMPRPDTPQALNATSYSIVECFSIIGWQAHRLQVRGYGPLHVVMGRFVRPAILLLERATEGLQTADWRYRLSESELCVLHTCIDLVIKVVTLVIVSAGRFLSPEEIMHGVCLDASMASLRGKDLLGLLRLHILLLSFYADGIPSVPPADLDLWLSRGLIIARSWELVEHISDYAVFLRDSADALLIGVDSIFRCLLSLYKERVAGFPLPRVMTSESEEFEGALLRPPLRHSITFYWFSEALTLCVTFSALPSSSSNGTVNPNFGDTIGFYHLPTDIYDCFQQCIHKTLELMHLISLTSPIYPSYVEIWDRVSHILPDEASVSDRSVALFDFMDEIVNAYAGSGALSPKAGVSVLGVFVGYTGRISRIFAKQTHDTFSGSDPVVMALP